MAAYRTRLLQGGALGAALLIAACGGGGGVNSTPRPTPAPSPTPTPTPTPKPTPTPTPANYDTSEYRGTVGAVSMNALVSYQAGSTGKNVKVGIVDSGIDLQNTSFANRIDPASADVAGSRGLDDEGGHGTAVAFTAAGGRNGTGAEGVAFDATLLVMRADSPGTCAQENTDDADSGCSFYDTAIAKGITVAAQNGARVINLSLGGDSPSQGVLDAIAAATKKGIIVVIAAGNDSTANPDPFADIPAKASASNGLVIIAGSVGANDLLSDFSDKAGDGASHYLAAVGDNVIAPCPGENTACLWAGTSLAAPQISGAVALLAQAFPNLTGAQIVSLLFESARDAGAAGVDATYGNGILDLTRAFQPIGATSVAGARGSVSLANNATLSAPMGDAAQGALGAVILDGFSRAFAVDLARTIRSSGPVRTLTGALQTHDRNYVVDAGRMSVAVTIAPGREQTRIDRTLLSPEQASGARAIAGIVTTRLGDKAQFAVGFSQSGATLEARLVGRSAPAFLVARDPTEGQGFVTDIGGSAAMRQQFGAWGITAAIENGAVLAPVTSDIALRDPYHRFGYNRMAIAADRRFGRLAASLSGSWLDERDTVLGARFGDGLGGARATSWFVDAAAAFDLGAGWSLNGTARQGWTIAQVRAGLTGSGLIRTNAYAASIAKDGVFGSSDTIGLGVAQPLRVSSGGIDLRLPTYYDYDTLAVTSWADQRLNLAPTGREFDVEARYAFALGAGRLETNLFWRRDPGNFAALPDDRGAALRYGLAF
ncbi:peptidase S8 [Sphingomonas koreensis]|nr:peptidase S8 [Sphingomonas koreensis]